MDRPIFIVGSPRSGTTLMREILDRHPAIGVCGETHFQFLVYRRRKAFGDLADPKNRQRVIDQYLTSRRIPKAGLDPSELAKTLPRDATSYKAMFAALLRSYADSKGKPRVGEKTPRHALFLETLFEWFPNAVVLHMVRDPHAVVASLEHEPWVAGSVVVNARRWLRLNQAARKSRSQPGYLEVRYENLVTDPESELRKICSFVGEEYEPSILVPEKTLSPDLHNRERPRAAVTASRMDVWRKELSTVQVSQIEWVLGPALEEFGYTREAPPASALTVLKGISYAAYASAKFAAARLPSFWYRFARPAKLAKFEDWTGPRTWRKDTTPR